MSITGVNNILASYQYANKTQRVEVNQAGFASYLQQISEAKTAANCDIRTFLQNNRSGSLNEFTASAVHNVKPAYEAYESKNYRLVPDNEAGCLDIYNKQGERIGAFDYADIKARQDSLTGKQFLISEHGTMSYDAVALDGELKEALQNVMGIEKLETEELSGFTLKTHSGTGIQYLLRDGEEGRGGKVLLQSQADIEKYEALMDTYFNKYPNLVKDESAANFWASLEIRGLAQRTNNGIISMHFDGMSYSDNNNYKNNWSVLFSEDVYKTVFDWLQNHRESIEAMQKFATWQEVFDAVGSKYERVWLAQEER